MGWTFAATVARIEALLAADPVCQGKVSMTAVREIAREFPLEARPDSDVLAERAACLAVLRGFHARWREMTEVVPGLDHETRRLGAAIETIELGLHRSNTPAEQI